MTDEPLPQSDPYQAPPGAYGAPVGPSVPGSPGPYGYSRPSYVPPPAPVPLTEAQTRRIRSLRLVRAGYAALIGIGLVVAAISRPQAAAEAAGMIVAAMLLLGLAAVWFVMARRAKPPWSPKVSMPLSIIGAMFGLLLAVMGVGHLYTNGQSATATTGDCYYVPGETVHSGHDYRYYPPYYSCQAQVTWPDGTSSTLSVQQDTNAPQTRTFVKEFGVLSSQVVMSWSAAIMFLAAGAMLIGQLGFAIAILVIMRRRPKRADAGLPPGMLST